MVLADTERSHKSAALIVRKGREHERVDGLVCSQQAEMLNRRRGHWSRSLNGFYLRGSIVT